LGLGRGEKGAFKGMGIKVTTFEAMADYIDIYRRLWAGEAVTYDGPRGRFEHLKFAETYEGRPPEIWLAGFAHEAGARLLAQSRVGGGILAPKGEPGRVGA